MILKWLKTDDKSSSEYVKNQGNPTGDTWLSDKIQKIYGRNSI